MNFTLTAEKAKIQAKSLAAYLATINRKVSHGNALEAVARIFGAKSWNVLSSQLDDVAVGAVANVETGQPNLFYLKNGEKVSAYVGAEMHSDDHRRNVDFDAAPWLLRASDEQILALAAIGWRGDYAADAVADGSRASNADVESVFSYVEFSDGMGFEVSVEEEDAMLFLRAFRYPLFVQVMLNLEFFGAANVTASGYVVRHTGAGQFTACIRHVALAPTFASADEAWTALGLMLEECDIGTPNVAAFAYQTVLRGSGSAEAPPEVDPKASADTKVLGRDDTVTGGVLVLKPDEACLTRKALRAITNDCEFRLKVAVPVFISSLIDNDIEGLNDLVSEAITGSVCDLTDLNFERYSPENESALIKMADVVFVSANWEPMDGVTDPID
jgi:hypothetical protein